MVRVCPRVNGTKKRPLVKKVLIKDHRSTYGSIDSCLKHNDSWLIDRGHDLKTASLELYHT